MENDKAVPKLGKVEPPSSEEEPKNAQNKDDKKKSKYFKELLEKDTDFPDVFADPDERNKLFEHLPLIKIKKLKKNPRILNNISGPHDPTYPIEPFIPWICGRSISTYPHVPGKPKRDGDPVCDGYCVQILEDNTVVCVVTDGCNWGKRPMEASNIAKDAFVEYMRFHQSDIVELRDVGHYLLRALSFCHYKIIEGKEDLWEAGTTTLLGGMIFRLKRSKEEKEKGKTTDPWVFACVSIGDCKAYHYSAKTKKVEDITAGNRRNVHDARDPGGRLGPYVGEGNPDLRNSMVYYTMCDEEDLILIVSDGVHDNLDPQILGATPKEADSQLDPNITDWRGFSSDDQVEKVKTNHMKKLLSEDLIGGGEEDRKLRLKIFAHAEEESIMSPESITNRIMKHCLAVTAKGRQWMEQNPKEKLPMDYSSFPGKMDHATVVAVRIGDYEKDLFKALEKKAAKK